tara:strand:+ start:87 stop:668 length:582 start_codon:yes stop_codon:yes gene_type:complete
MIGIRNICRVVALGLGASSSAQSQTPVNQTGLIISIQSERIRGLREGIEDICKYGDENSELVIKARQIYDKAECVDEGNKGKFTRSTGSPDYNPYYSKIVEEPTIPPKDKQSVTGLNCSTYLAVGKALFRPWQNCTDKVESGGKYEPPLSLDIYNCECPTDVNGEQSSVDEAQSSGLTNIVGLAALSSMFGVD